MDIVYDCELVGELLVLLVVLSDSVVRVLMVLMMRIFLLRVFSSCCLLFISDRPNLQGLTVACCLRVALWLGRWEVCWTREGLIDVLSWF